MNSFKAKLKETTELRHPLSLPCDLHALQLLIKDILELAEFKLVHSKVNRILAHFKKAPKAYALLRELQQLHYNETFALKLAVETRWGSQFYAFNRLLQNWTAIEAFALQIKEKRPKKA
jgi:hypothetical protein